MITVHLSGSPQSGEMSSAYIEFAATAQRRTARHLSGSESFIVSVHPVIGLWGSALIDVGVIATEASLRDSTGKRNHVCMRWQMNRELASVAAAGTYRSDAATMTFHQTAYHRLDSGHGNLRGPRRRESPNVADHSRFAPVGNSIGTRARYARYSTPWYLSRSRSSKKIPTKI
jgi:hypothetical protein